MRFPPNDFPEAFLVLDDQNTVVGINPAGEKFESERLYKTFEENKHLDAQGIAKAISGAVEDFMEGTPAKDDLTIVALKFA